MLFNAMEFVKLQEENEQLQLALRKVTSDFDYWYAEAGKLQEQMAKMIDFMARRKAKINNDMLKTHVGRNQRDINNAMLDLISAFEKETLDLILAFEKETGIVLEDPDGI